MSEDSPPDDEVKHTRREALVAGSCAGVIGAGVMAGPIGMALDPLLRGHDGGGSSGVEGAEGAAYELGKVSQFKVGDAPKRLILKRDMKDAWLVRKGVPFGAVLVQRTTQTAFNVFSAVCPHLGCSVSPSKDGKGYHCPCHQSFFALDGAIKTGPSGRKCPSPRALDPLPWVVERERLVVTWKRFKIGIPEREELT